MKILVWLLLGFFSICLSAQNVEHYIYQFPERIPDQYSVDPIIEYNSILTNIDRTNRSSRKCERWAEILAFEKSERFYQGKIYMGWVEAENYLNEILEKLINANNLDHSKLHAYLMRSSEINAFSTPDGSIFITVGFLAEMENEASLAAIIGHEMSHIINKDSEVFFFDGFKKYNHKYRNTYDLNVAVAHDNQSVEHRCDKEGWTYAFKAGYNLESARSNAYTSILSNDEKKVWNRKLVNDGLDKTKSLDYILSTHPDSRERLDSLEKFITNNPQPSAKTDLVDGKYFEYLKQQCRLQNLDISHEWNYNFPCAERALTYLFSDLNNPDYLFHSYESLRRLIYFNAELKNKAIMSDYYPIMPEIRTWNDLLTLMMKYPERINSAFESQIVEKFDTPPTYEEMMSYLEGLIKKNRVVEGYLSIALFHKYDNKNLYVEYLEAYQSSPTAQHKLYASKMEAGTLELINDSKDYFLFDEINFVEDRYYGLHNRRLQARERNSQIMQSARSFISRKYTNEANVLSIVDLQQNSFRQYMEFMDLTYTVNYYEKLSESNSGEKKYKSQEIIFKKSEEDETDKDVKPKKYLFEFSPEAWEIYNKYRIANLGLISGIAIDKRDVVSNIFSFCCMPYYMTLYTLMYGSLRYQYRVGYVKVNLKSEKIDKLDDIYDKKFTIRKFFSDLEELMDIIDDKQKRESNT